MVDDDSDVEMEEDPDMVDVDANMDVIHPIEIEPEVQVESFVYAPQICVQ